jgi:hypothetical protein
MRLMGHLISFASSPCIMCNTRHSDTTTVWFDVVDSQSGASAKALINSSIQFGLASCLICGARANPGTPLCQRCWHWGHSAHTCTSHAPKCPQCSGPHSGDNHHANCGSCKGNPNVKPRPVPPTVDGLACPHLGHCVNCKGEHSANDNKCPFWRH